jgi:RNA recognition motif-containing protein
MKKIYVGNIPYNASEEDLRELFSECGEVESIKIMKDQFTGGSKGFGFIEMANENDAKKAIATLQGRDLKGKSLTVAEARPQQKRQERQGFNNRGSGYGGGGTGRGQR